MERPTRRGRATQRAFEDAARTVIARQGFLRTTIADIAREAGRSPGSFYNYYDSKEALLAHLADEFRDTVTGRARPVYRKGTPARTIIEESVRAYWQTYAENLAVMVGVAQVATLDDGFAARWREIRQSGVDSIATTIRRAQRDGWCPGLDPRLAASAIGSMMEHFCYVWLSAGGDGSGLRATDEEAIATLTEIWYRATHWRPGPDGGDGSGVVPAGA